ncbi:hypothetical protein M3Y99_01167500 [Aphelenchoides fujianensis]|nr:hypothetical protein M3Y99_01167500 [Aphelenchoides fujianensis]
MPRMPAGWGVFSLASRYSASLRHSGDTSAFGLRSSLDSLDSTNRSLQPRFMSAEMRDETQADSQLQMTNSDVAAEMAKLLPQAAMQLAGDAAFSTPAVSPFFDLAHGFTRQMLAGNRQKHVPSLLAAPEQPRKRRRVHANSDNTLDGLVAKRAEVEPNSKRYQTETEAIELPDDEEEIKRLESDPDVATRMCSICGYQGKWVSEMHESNGRADENNNEERECGDEEEEVDVKDFATPPAAKKRSLQSASATPSNPPPQFVYRCLTCSFEDESMDVLADHLRNVHDLAPFECRQCRQTFGTVQHVSQHCTQPGAVCAPLHIVINFNLIADGAAPTTPQSAPAALAPPPQLLLPKPQPTLPTGLLALAPPRAAGGQRGVVGSPLSIDSDTASATSASTSCISADFEHPGVRPTGAQHACTECPFRTASLDKLAAHRAGHEMPRGLFNYKCVFCNWYSKKKTAIEKHMHVHTAKPQQFMAQVERNVVPALLTAGVPTSAPLAGLPSAASSFAAAFAARPMFGGAAASHAQLMTPSIASAPGNGGADAFGLLSALYGGVPATATSPVAPISALSSASAFGLSTPLPSARLPDMSAFKELTANPLLTISLASLLDQMNGPQSSVAAVAAALQQATSAASLMPAGPLGAATFDSHFA